VCCTSRKTQQLGGVNVFVKPNKVCTYLVYPVARAYEAKHYSKWYYVRMPAVTNIVVQKPKVAACQKKTKRLLHLNIIPPCSAGFV